MESSPLHQRDMSRAYWQRSTGMVLFTEYAEEVYADSHDALSDNDLITVLDGSRQDTSVSYATAALPSSYRYAYMIARKLFDNTTKSSWETESVDRVLRYGIEDYTFRGTFHGDFLEANQTMGHFPLNLAFTISQFTAQERIPGYGTDSLSQITALLRRPDYRSIAHDAAFTINGWWGGQSNTVVPDLNDGKQRPIIQYNPENKSIVLSDTALHSLRANLARNNKLGKSFRGDVSSLTSSGCPVRHNRPHFNSSDEDQIQLRALAKHTGKTIAELTAPRQRTGIDVGIDYLAEALDRAAKLQTTLAATALTASV